MKFHSTSILVLMLVSALTSQAEIAFEKTQINDVFVSEGCAVLDVNNDGKKDVAAGDYWYSAPDWKQHAFREPGSYSFDKGYSQSFVNGSMDVNLDGWEDILVVGFPGEIGWWYENPQNKEGHWKRHGIHQSVCNESPTFADFDGDGRSEAVFPSATDRRWAWFEAPTEKGGTEFARYIISEATVPGTDRFSHGLGLVDVNGDGRLDLTVTEGWWECPEDRTQPDWTWHPAPLGPPCAHMYGYDFDRDGDTDIVSSSAHNYGIWWYEQGKDEQGNTTWTQHEIHKEVSQTHSLNMVDMNGDGLPDLVTGKRFFAHNGNDPGAHEPAVLMWFELAIDDGKPSWTPHVIDDNSGVGTQFVVADINGDGKPDIATSNKKGTHVFIQTGAKSE
jgi:hypothetical protein